MREIKFQVIDKNLKIIGIEILKDGHWEWMCYELNPDKGERWTEGVFHNSDQYRLIRRQYTGLKDKNGKEIYEGDIVSIPSYGNAIIIWNEGICAFQYAYHAIGRGTSIGGRMTNTLYDHESEVKYEIIGNIYKNPDLIK